MLITQYFSWPSTNWPSTAPASQYALFQLSPALTGNQTNPVQTISGTSAILTYDDTLSLLYQVRPTDGLGNYGPELMCIVINFVPCRAYLRQRIRFALGDVLTASGNPKWSDAEINGYMNEAVAEISVLFPHQEDVTISLLPPSPNIYGVSEGVRDYALPTDCYRVRSVEYISDQTGSGGNLHLYLKEKPFRGGESTSTSYVGYPKLGILISPTSGRYYPGHYDVYENTLFLDWDPNGDGDQVHVRYYARYPIPVDDSTLLTMPQEDLELVSLRVQMKCWLRIEGQDVNLSRFKEQGRRDDLPTEKMSDRLKKLYNEVVNDRRERRVRTFRMVRR